MWKTITLNNIDIRVNDTEHLIHVNDVNENKLADIWDELCQSYPDYDVELCFHNMPAPVNILNKIGAKIMDDMIDFRVSQESFKPFDFSSVKPLTKEDFPLFSSLHDKIPDMYWTSQRILNNLEKWRVFLLWENDEVIGYSMIFIDLTDATLGEIFSVQAEKDEHLKALMSATVQSAFEINKSMVVMMIDRDKANDKAVALSIGFREVGYYIGYQAICKKREK